MSLFSILFALATSFLQVQTQLDLRIPQGALRGMQQRSQTGKDLIAFLGIPYALPPVGKLRFKLPLAHPGWSGTLDATKFREACAQFDSSGEILGSEDCLYLNVFTRVRSSNAINPFQSPPYMNAQFPMDPFVSIPKPPPLHPVFVFFHAESFESGDASLYGPDKLLDKEMILVTLNYRLGILGYLSTEDEHAPGNLALHDQRMALIWVQKNIRLFGGDPTRITIGGQGAGAASVFDHLLSRWSSGFFHAAILQSGSGLCSWARERRPVTFAKKVADLVGCGRRMSINEPNHNQKTNLPASIQDKIRFLNRPQESNLINRSSKNHANEIEQEPFSSKQIVDCLRKVSASALLKAQTAFKVFGEFPQRAAPIVEEHPNGFLIDEPINLLKRSIVNKVPVILGWNTNEGAYFYSLIKALDFSANLEYYQRVIVPKFVEATMYLNQKVSKPAMQQIVNQYFPYDLKANESELALQFVKMATDGMYGWCMETTASALSDAGLPVHVYQYDYRGSNSMLELLLRLQQESGSPVQHNLHNPSSSDIPRPSPSAAAPMSPPVLPHNMQRLVCHGDELFSLFQLKISGLRASSEMDNLVSVQLTSMWAEFASLHNQSWLFKTDRGLWPTFRSKRQVLLVQQTPKVITLPVQPAFLFWQQLHSAIQSNSTAATVHNSGYLPVINPDALYEPATDPPGSSNTTKYATLAFTMIGVSIGLLLLVVLLLAILWYTKRSQSFSAIVADGTNSPSLY